MCFVSRHRRRCNQRGIGYLFRTVGPAGGLQLILHNHSLTGHEGWDYVAIYKDQLVNEMKSQAYPYAFIIDNELLESLRDIYMSGVYTWDS